LQDLREHYDENTYYPADLQWRDQRIRNVGIRSRGLGSRNPTKPGLRVDFNRYVQGQQLLGLKSLVLDNLVQDASMLRERLALGFFARMGEPASRIVLGRLYINDRFQGVYAFIEAVDGDFVERQLGERSGYLFERHFNGPFRGEDLGDDFAAWRAVFKPTNHEQEPDSVLYPPIHALFTEANDDVDGAWRERVEHYIDLRQLVTHVAIETFLSEADGVLGYAGMANFYLFRPSTSDRHRLIVWDKDRTFADITSSIVQRVDQNVLIRRALSFDDLWRLYLDVLERCARTAQADGWLERLIDTASAAIDLAAQVDGDKPYSNDDHQAAVSFVREFAHERPAFVLQEISRGRDR